MSTFYLCEHSGTAGECARVRVPDVLYVVVDPGVSKEPSVHVVALSRAKADEARRDANEKFGRIAGTTGAFKVWPIKVPSL